MGIDPASVAVGLAIVIAVIGVVYWRGRAPDRESDEVRWTQELRKFLESHAHFRRWSIILTTVVSPVVLVVLSFHDLLPISKDQALGAVIALASAGVIFGALLAFTEQTSGEISARAGELDLQLRDALASLEQERTARKIEGEAAEREKDRLAALAALRERHFGYLVLDHAETDTEREVLIWVLTNELAALGSYLFDWDASERWSLAVYLHDETEDDLFCAADFRNHSNDFGEGHRRWSVGLGMVGITFRAGRELVLSDAESSDLREVMRDPNDERAEEDRIIYRSVAALPIFKPEAYTTGDGDIDDGDEAAEPEAPPLFGIVVATSDKAMRFTSDGEDRLAPLRALADAVGMVLMTGELKRTFTVDSPKLEGPAKDGRDDEK